MQKPRWSLRLTRALGEGTASAYARKLRVQVGAPLTFDEQYPHLTALELALAALAADLVNGFAALAQQRRVEIQQLEAVVHGELDNPLVHAGVIGVEGTPALDQISIKVYASSLEDESV